MSSSSQVVESWISCFCSLLGHEFFAEVSEDFIEDDFNLTGLSSQVPMYKEALEMILDVEPEDDDDEEEEEEEEEEDDDLELMDDYSRPQGYKKERQQRRLDKNAQVIEESAELLYGLIHQRYITSRPGLGQMHEKYEQGHFGFCPRVFCNGAKVLPVGVSDIPGTETVKLFCPSCLDVYTPPNSRFQTVDGAYFGTTFGCLFLMSFPELSVGALRQVLSPSPTANTDDANSIASRTSYLSPQPTNSPSAPRRPEPRTSAPQPTEINGVATSNFAPGLGVGNFYEGRIYGFRINERARSGPRMKWLRMKPDDIRELDEGKRFELLQAHSQQKGEMQEDDDANDDELDADLEDMYDAAEVEVNHANGPSQRSQQMDIDAAIGQRKKAPMRRRARRPDDPGTMGQSSVTAANGAAVAI